MATATPRLKPLSQRTALLWMGVLAMAAGTLLIGFFPGPGVARKVIVVLSAIFPGCGSAILVTAWGECFSSMTAKRAGLYYGGSVAFGTVVFFTTSFLPPTIATFFVAVLPLISAGLLALNRESPGPETHLEVESRFAIPFPPIWC
ncbi:MAG: hypothetical protein M1335_02045 [Chloroflexi bacterium]|nr:hypothetical protein [Chloroflexota bacterium]